MKSPLQGWGHRGPGARPAVPEGREGSWKRTHKHMLPSLEIHDFTQALVSSSKCGVTLVCLLLLVCGRFDISFLDLHKKFLSDLETHPCSLSCSPDPTFHKEAPPPLLCTLGLESRADLSRYSSTLG